MGKKSKPEPTNQGGGCKRSLQCGVHDGKGLTWEQPPNGIGKRARGSQTTIEIQNTNNGVTRKKSLNSKSRTIKNTETKPTFVFKNNTL